MKDHQTSLDPLKIVVIGASGLIGSKLTQNLRRLGHEVIGASPSSGVNTLTGEGLAAALTGAHVVVDVANSPSFEDGPVLNFFETSGRNLRDAEVAAGVAHHVCLSVVGTERLLASGYFRAKMAQETIIRESSVPYSIVRATQFFEFVKAIAHGGAVGDEVQLPPALMQPIAAEDVARLLADTAVSPPRNAMLEIAGPEAIRQDEMVRRFFQATGDPRTVVTNPAALYFGTRLDDRSLVPGPDPRLGNIRFADWLQPAAKCA